MNLDRPRPQTSDQAGTLASEIYGKLRRAIISAEVLPGERLRVEALRARYQTGGSPVREALNRLSPEGLVSQEDQKGFRVGAVSIADLVELTRARCLLNTLLLRELIAHGDTHWENAAIGAFHRMSRVQAASLEAGVLDPSWHDLHRAFHFSLLSACQAAPLLEVSEALFDRADRYRNLANATRAEGRDVDREHRQILDAALDRDADKAAELLNAHVLATTETLRGSEFTRLSVAAPSPPNPGTRRLRSAGRKASRASRTIEAEFKTPAGGSST